MAAEPTQVITAAEARNAEQERRSLKARIGDRYGIDPEVLLPTLRATVFKGEVSTEQLVMLLVVADQHKLNPFTKEIFAFPSQQGIVPVVGVDGWARIVNEHPQFDGMDFVQTEESCTCTMHRKDRKHPTVVTEYLSECKRATGPWQTHPKRMLRHKAMIQCARIAFSFAGIYDPDEAEAIVQAEIDVTPPEERTQETEFGPAKVGAVRMRKIVQGTLKAIGLTEDGMSDPTKESPDDYRKIWDEITKAERELIWGKLRSYERAAIKAFETKINYKHGMDLDAWAIEAMKACKEPASLETIWGTVQEAYAENDLEVPLDVQTFHTDRKTELGVV